MVKFQPSQPPGQYQLVAASQTTKTLGAVGASGDYLESITIIPATTTPGAVNLFDGTTSIFLTVAGTATVLPGVIQIPIRAYSTTGKWNITTGASVSVLCVGQFT
jgi:hypothetical protein